MSIGDIHGVYTRVMEQFDHADRKSLAKKVRKDLGNLCKSPDETFATFASRVNDIFLRMKLHNLSVDRALVLDEVSNALMPPRSKCEMTKLCYDEFVDRLTQDQEDALEATGLMDGLRKPMLRREQRQITKQKPTRVNVAEQSQKMVLDEEDLWGVCLSFQKGTCKKKTCDFRHVKLSADQSEALLKKVEAAVKCHACGGRGHRKSDCPKSSSKSKINVNAAAFTMADTAAELIKRLKTASVTTAEKAELKKLLN